jgi:hypothetical protein
MKAAFVVARQNIAAGNIMCDHAKPSRYDIEMIAPCIGNAESYLKMSSAGYPAGAQCVELFTT